MRNGEEAGESKPINYYISDVYGSFNNLFFDHAHAQPVPMQRNKKFHLDSKIDLSGTDLSSDADHQSEHSENLSDSFSDASGSDNSNPNLVEKEEYYGSSLPKETACGSPSHPYLISI